jgi:hypothetical protein
MALARPATGLKVLKATKRYILSTLLATIAMAILVTVSFIMLSPARVKFSVVHCDRHRRANGSVAITFTMSANNTSHRAAVVYESMFIDLSQQGKWSPGNVTTEMPLLQSPGALMTFDALVTLVDKPWDDLTVITSNKTTGNFTVMVTAVAWFKVGVARTRQYDIMVSCGPAEFLNPRRINIWPVDCA